MRLNSGKNIFRQWYRLFLFICIILIFILFILHEKGRQSGEKSNLTLLHSGQIERCLLCHSDFPDPGISHQIKEMGCTPCHLGDPLATTKRQAHQGMVLNGSDLRYVNLTCGRSKCHPSQVHKVENSVMATNIGIIDNLFNLFSEKPKLFPKEQIGTEEIINSPKLKQFKAVLLYRKLCGSCHLWKKHSKGNTEYKRKGGGCSACHQVDRAGHSLITARVPDSNCYRCHNRSGRIALSYTGKIESAHYGTLFENGILASHRLDKHRFYAQDIADIHHSKGLWCIDCHTELDLMGDGKRYQRKTKQVDITCENCHGNENSNIQTIPLNDATKNLIRVLELPIDINKITGFLVSKHKYPLYNIIIKQGKPDIMISKGTGKKYEIKQISTDGIHFSKIHKRLTCQACHSYAAPQCYGCHTEYYSKDRQYDHISAAITSGQFYETRDFNVCFRKPALGVTENGKVAIMVPGMHFNYSDIDQPKNDFNLNRYARLSPHTTIKKVDSCIECHTSTRRLGRGEGVFISHKSGEKGLSRQTYTIKRKTNKSRQFQIPDSWENLNRKLSDSIRPFTQKEIDEIVKAADCIVCHSDYNDPIYINFAESKKHLTKECY